MTPNRFASFALSLALVAASCDRSDYPVSPVRDQVRSVASQPFYYYQGQPVYLIADPSRVIVDGDTAALSHAEALARGLGGAVGSVDSIHSYSGHRILHLRSLAADSFVARLRRDPTIQFASVAYKTPDNHDVIPVNRVVVHFKGSTTPQEIQALASQLGLQQERGPNPDSAFTSYWFAYPRDSEPLALAAILDRNPLVDWADPDKLVQVERDGAPNDPYYAFQYYLKNTVAVGGVSVDANVEPAWAITTGAHGVKVAILDDGVDANNADICGLALGIGYDLYPFIQGEDTYHPNSADYHGTSVAGIISGCRNNGLGIAGIASGISVISVRIIHTGQNPSTSQVAGAITWAWQAADVLSNSWSLAIPSNDVTNAINTGTTSGRQGLGTAIVFSAGNPSVRSVNNFGVVTYPASVASTIAVSAIDHLGQPADYAPRGTGITLVAVSSSFTDACHAEGGSGIGDLVTTDLSGTAGCNDGPNGDINFTSTFGGTSAAAPQVAAAIALLYSVNPNMSLGAVKSRLTSTADPWGASNDFGAGKLNIFRVLCPSDLEDNISGPAIITSKANYTWSANPSGCDGLYTFNWTQRYDDGEVVSLGSTQTVTLTVHGGDPNFWLIDTINGGTTLTDSLYVTNCIGVKGGCGNSAVRPPHSK